MRGRFVVLLRVVGLLLNKVKLKASSKDKQQVKLRLTMTSGRGPFKRSQRGRGGFGGLGGAKK